MDCQATLSISVTQCDPTSAPTPLHWPAPATVHVSCPAKHLSPQQRQGLAIQVLAGTETVSGLARQHEVSRKFLYQQVHTAEEALNEAFAPSSRPDDVLFYLPVTKAWLRQLVLGLVLICHSSTRGVVELLRDLFDFRISLGTVHNIVHSPVPHARRINEQYDLSTILIGLLDEIFQAGDPVLVGVDAKSTFCFLLSPEEHCDADTWGIRLLELVDRGFAPEATIADFASGLRAGHQEALHEVPCRLQRLRRLRGSGSGDPPAGHPLPPRMLAESRRPEPGGPTARRCPIREPLRIDPDQFHHLSVSLPARHLQVGVTTIRVVEGSLAGDGGPGPGPTSRRYQSSRSLPRAVLEIRGSGEEMRRLPLDRVLPLVGGFERCHVRLAGPGISRFVCGLLRTSVGVWADTPTQLAGPISGLGPDFSSVGPLPPALLDRPGALLLEAALRPLLKRGGEGPSPDVASSPFGQALILLIRLLGDMHRDHLKLVREELEQIRRINLEMKATRRGWPAPTPAPAPRRRRPAVPRRTATPSQGQGPRLCASWTLRPFTAWWGSASSPGSRRGRAAGRGRSSSWSNLEVPPPHRRAVRRGRPPGLATANRLPSAPQTRPKPSVMRGHAWRTSFLYLILLR